MRLYVPPRTASEKFRAPFVGKFSWQYVNFLLLVNSRGTRLLVGRRCIPDHVPLLCDPALNYCTLYACGQRGRYRRLRASPSVSRTSRYARASPSASRPRRPGSRCRWSAGRRTDECCRAPPTTATVSRPTVAGHRCTSPRRGPRTTPGSPVLQPVSPARLSTELGSSCRVSPLYNNSNNSNN